MKFLIICMTMVLLLSSCATATLSGYGNRGSHESDGRSYQQRQSDSRLSAEVIGSLIEDRQVRAIDIEVSVHYGVVTLKGEVAGADMASRAIRLTETVDGVQRVINQLRHSTQ